MPTSVKEPLFRKSSANQNLINSKLPAKQHNPESSSQNHQNQYSKQKLINSNLNSGQQLPNNVSEFDLRISELTNEASIRQDILGIISISNHNNNNNIEHDNEQDLSEYDDYLRDLENNDEWNKGIII